jgi:hypothetical protein
MSASRRTEPPNRITLEDGPCNPLHAINFILDGRAEIAPGEAEVFLKAWREGDFSEWPEYLGFVAAIALLAAAGTGLEQ